MDGDGTISISTGSPSREYAEACGDGTITAADIISAQTISLPTRRANPSTAQN
jgi:hypothetical protein